MELSIQENQYQQGSAQAPMVTSGLMRNRFEADHEEKPQYAFVRHHVIDQPVRSLLPL
jgi:hypothetical protein